MGGTPPGWATVGSPDVGGTGGTGSVGGGGAAPAGGGTGAPYGSEGGCSLVIGSSWQKGVMRAAGTVRGWLGGKVE